MTRNRIWIAAAAMLLVLAGAAGLALAQVSSGDAEVRISARRLDDGQTKFALQQRINGQWAERDLPRARFFPANPSSDNWLTSSPLLISTESDESEVSEAVEALKAELATAQKELDTTKEALAEANFAAEEAEAALAQFTAPVVRTPWVESYDDGRFETSVTSIIEQGGSEILLNTEITGYPEPNDEHDHAIRLSISCETDGRRLVSFFGVPASVGSDRQGSTLADVTVEFEFSPEPDDWTRRSGSATWYAQDNFWDDDGTLRVWVQADSKFYLRMRGADTLTLAFTGVPGEPLTVVFNLEGVFDTPIQPNIDRCGDYY